MEFLLNLFCFRLRWSDLIHEKYKKADDTNGDTKKAVQQFYDTS